MYQQFACIVLSAASLVDDRPIRISATFPQSACAVNTHLLIVYCIYKCLLQKNAAVKDNRVVNANTECFSLIFITPPTTQSSPQECSHPQFLPSYHTCMCLLCFSAIVTTPLPDAHKMGLSGKTFAPHISHKGSLWPITVLMEARDSHQLHAFFPSYAWTQAKARRALVLTLVMVFMMYRKVLHGGTWQLII